MKARRLFSVRERRGTLRAPARPRVDATRGTKLKQDVPAAIERAPLLGGVGRRLYRFSRTLARQRTADVPAVIARTLAQAVNAQMAALAIPAESEQALAVAATYGYPQAAVDHVRIASGAGIIGEVFATGRAWVGAPSERGAPRRLRYRTDSCLAVPLLASVGCVGVVAVTDRRDGRPFDRRDVAIASKFAPVAALALERERLRQSLEAISRSAAVDPVTRLANRRDFDRRLQAEVERARRQQQQLALLMIDVDGFKRVNDWSGHVEGDAVLAAVADVLRTGVRVFDVCARYGGDEFAVLMPGASGDVAHAVAERIRRRVEGSFRQAAVPVSVSVGAATLGAGGSPRALLASADKQLQFAKAAGKNCVRLQPPSSLDAAHIA